MLFESFINTQRPMWQLLTSLQSTAGTEIVWNHVKERLKDLHAWLNTYIEKKGLCFGMNMKTLAEYVEKLTRETWDKNVLAKLLLDLKDILQNLTVSLGESFVDVKEFLRECREALSDLHTTMTPHPAHAYHSTFNWT